MNGVEELLDAISALDCDRNLKAVLSGIVNLVDTDDLDIRTRDERGRKIATKKAHKRAREAAEGDSLYQPLPGVTREKRSMANVIPKDAGSDIPVSLIRLAECDYREYDSTSS